MNSISSISNQIIDSFKEYTTSTLSFESGKKVMAIVTTILAGIALCFAIYRSLKRKYPQAGVSSEFGL